MLLIDSQVVSDGLDGDGSYNLECQCYNLCYVIDWLLHVIR
jgi:hypothetical protein